MNAPRRYKDMAEFQASLPPPKPVPRWLTLIMGAAWLGLLFVGIFWYTAPVQSIISTINGTHHSEEK